MSGRAIASRFTTSRQAAYSARSRAQELAPRRHPREQLLDRDPRAGRQRGRPLPRQRAIVDDARPAVGAAHPAFDASAARRWRSRAAPRRESPASRPASIASSGSLEVAWRSSASAISSRRHAAAVVGHLDPVDAAAATSATAIRVAPASIAFSTSSFNALAGLSTTSPAAMRLTRCSGRRRIDMDIALDRSGAVPRARLTLWWTGGAGPSYRKVAGRPGSAAGSAQAAS